MSAENDLIAAIASKQPQVRLHCKKPDLVFKAALRADPRILAFVTKYQYQSVSAKRSLLMGEDYDLMIEYNDNAPNDINDVQIDRGSWDAESLMTADMPQSAAIVTQNIGRIEKSLNETLPLMISAYEGLFGWKSTILSYEKITDYQLIQISFDYITDEAVLEQMKNKARFGAKQIWKKILGNAKVPQFVLPFLALSYLAQECAYDQKAFDEVEKNQHEQPSDPIPSLSYGPLVEHRGICGGLAWAYKRLMDEAGIECSCVSGFLKEDTSTGHAWDLVKLDGQYYHVDPTWGIKDRGVHVDGLLQPDAVFRSTHIWDTNRYPAANGLRFQYDFIEDYLVENGMEYLDDGAEEKYMFPDDIVE